MYELWPPCTRITEKPGTLVRAVLNPRTAHL